ncbi:hypothetical protein [Desulfosporosinus sp.]|uniref:hypothetical protein n=1 Tax=Desulfosporosinus sp. TaxID=157907 RepID=UPI002632FF9C|nr:hypothetical protein [Desulfosporosinus sp.]
MYVVPLHRQPILKPTGQHNRQIQINLDSWLQVMDMAMATVTATAVVVEQDIIEECGKMFSQDCKNMGRPN